MSKLIDEIKARWLSVYRYYVPNIEINKNILCPLPGHRDQKTKSFHLYQDGGFKCFGCGRSGDCIDFVKIIENMPDDKSAVKRCADILGLNMQTQQRKNKTFSLSDLKNWRQGDYKFARLHKYTAGNPPYIKVILKNSQGDKTALFFSETPNGFVKGRKSKPVLYKQEELQKRQSETVCYVEGEKDADTLSLLGFLAVTAGGVSDWTPYFRHWGGKHFEGREVVIFPDFDAPGKTLAAQVAVNLENIAKSIKIVNLENAFTTHAGTPIQPKQDISDFVSALRLKGLKDADIKNIITDLIANAQPVAKTQPPQAQTQTQTASQPIPQNGDSYFVGPDGYLYKDLGQNKQPRRLANFVAKIDQVIIDDDGLMQQRIHIISGTSTKGPLPPIEVPVVKFQKMDWVSAWSPKAQIEPGHNIRDMVRHAIEVMSDGVPEKYFYCHTGWRQHNGQWVYLHAKGAVGGQNVAVRLPPELERYALPDPPRDPAKAVHAALGFLDAGKQEIIYPLFAYVFLAPLTTLVDPPAFSLYCYGPTGTFKTTTAILALSFFGNFNYTKHSSFADTVNSLERRSFLLKDTLHLVDDLNPAVQNQQRQHSESVAQYLVRIYANRTARGRLKPDTEEKPRFEPRGLLLVTGEDTIKLQSTQARLLTLQFEKDALDRTMLAALYENRHLLQQAMTAYILYIRDRIPYLQDDLKILIDKARADMASKPIHARLADVLAYLMLATLQFTNFAVKTGVMTDKNAYDFREHAKSVFETVIAQQAFFIAKEDPAELFAEIIRTLIAQRKVLILDKDNPYRDPQNRADVLGFKDKDFYYLIATAAHNAVQRYCRSENEVFPLTPYALHQALFAKGVLVPGTDRLSTIIKAGSETYRVLKLKKSFIELPDPTPQP